LVKATSNLRHVVAGAVTKTDMNKDSTLIGVSVRGWIAMLCVLTVCLMQSAGLKVEEPLYSLALMSAGFYLGSKTPATKSE
jgi:hypothetical protein